MKKDSFVFKIPGAAFIFLVLLFPSHGHAAGVTTSYKQYSVFTYENENILCEPYQVKKNDWLYKIFRKKVFSFKPIGLPKLIRGKYCAFNSVK